MRAIKAIAVMNLAENGPAPSETTSPNAKCNEYDVTQADHAAHPQLKKIVERL
jgi:hypothetical protein